MMSRKELESKVAELTIENSRKETEIRLLTELLENKNIGVMTVEVSMNQTPEKINEILDLVKNRMNSEMEKLGVEMDWIVMPGVVKDVQTIEIRVKRN